MSDDAYLIQTTLIDDDHRYEDFSALAQWFDLFRIVEG